MTYRVIKRGKVTFGVNVSMLNLAKSNVQGLQAVRESKKASANFLGSRSLNAVDKTLH